MDRSTCIKHQHSLTLRLLGVQLVSQANPMQHGSLSVSHTGKETLGRFPCATSRTYRASRLSRLSPVRDTESDPHWGWFIASYLGRSLLRRVGWVCGMRDQCTAVSEAAEQVNSWGGGEANMQINMPH